MKVDALKAKNETLFNQLHTLQKLLLKVNKSKQERLSHAQTKNVRIYFLRELSFIFDELVISHHSDFY